MPIMLGEKVCELHFTLFCMLVKHITDPKIQPRSANRSATLTISCISRQVLAGISSTPMQRCLSLQMPVISPTSMQRCLSQRTQSHQVFSHRARAGGHEHLIRWGMPPIATMDKATLHSHGRRLKGSECMYPSKFTALRTLHALTVHGPSCLQHSFFV